MTKQAPLPWTLTQNSWQYTTIYDAEGNHVCRLDLEDWSVTEENQDELEKVQTQIASRIVKAVNNHDTLVRALVLARKRIEYLGAACNDPRHFETNARTFLPAVDEVLDAVGVPR